MARAMTSIVLAFLFLHAADALITSDQISKMYAKDPGESEAECLAETSQETAHAVAGEEKVCEIKEAGDGEGQKVRVTLKQSSSGCTYGGCNAFKLQSNLVSKFMKATTKSKISFGECSCRKFKPDDPDSEVELVKFGFSSKAPCDAATCFGQYAKVVYAGNLVDTKFSVADYDTFSINNWKVGCVDGEASIEDLTTVGEMVMQASPGRGERLRQAAGILDVKLPPVPVPSQPVQEDIVPDEEEEEVVEFRQIVEVRLVDPEFKDLALTPDAKISMINSDENSINDLLPGDIIDEYDDKVAKKEVDVEREVPQKEKKVSKKEKAKRIVRYIEEKVATKEEDMQEKGESSVSDDQEEIVILKVIRPPVVKPETEPAKASNLLRKILVDAMAELDNIEVIIAMVYPKIMEVQEKLGDQEAVEMVAHARVVAQKAKDARGDPSDLDVETVKVIQDFGPLDLLGAADVVKRLDGLVSEHHATLQASITWLVNVLLAVPATIERLQDDTFTKAFGEVNTVFGAEITRLGGDEPQKDKLVRDVIKPILAALRAAFDTHDAARVSAKDFNFDGSNVEVLGKHVEELQGVKTLVTKTSMNMQKLLALLDSQ